MREILRANGPSGRSCGPLVEDGDVYEATLASPIKEREFLSRPNCSLAQHGRQTVAFVSDLL